MRSHFLSVFFRFCVAISLAGSLAMAGSRQTCAESATPAPKQKLYLEEAVIQGPADPAFASYWRDQTDLIWWDSQKPVVRTGHVTDADGRRLVVTTIYDPGECGIKLCPIRILTEAGDMLLDTIACNANEFHRISSDRRYLIACGQAMRIPETASRVADKALPLATGPTRTLQSKVENIPYDSGTELPGPKEDMFHRYWSDKAGQIDWKQPVSRRGMIYNWALPSADGRDLFLTMLQSPPGTACDSRCPVRVFTRQQKRIMDFMACSDREQHGVSADHRFFVACGESFPIPQVDDRTAIMENAPLDSNAEAYVEVVRRRRAKPAGAPEPVQVDSAYHNNSQMLVSEWKDATVEITYDIPRPGLAVAQGTLLFRGIRQGARYSGTAYTFKDGCAPAPYAVTGMKDQKKEMIVMTGAAPRRDPHSCEIIGETAQSGSAKLVFDTKFYGDE